AGDRPAVQGKVESWYFRANPADAFIEVDKGPEGDLGIHETVHLAKDGTFLLEGVALAGAELRLRRWSGGVGMLVGQAVTVAEPFPMRFDLPRHDEAVIAGRVLDHAGKPLADAAVLVDPAVSGPYKYQQVDGSGRFVFGDLEPAHYYINAYSKWAIPAEIEVDLAAAQKMHDLTIGLLPCMPRIVHGRVVGPDGRAGVADATLQFWLGMPPAMHGRHGRGNGHHPRFVYEALSDEEGTFAAMIPNNLGPGAHVGWWDIVVKAEGYLERRYLGFSTTSPAAPLELQLFRGGSVSGRVLLADGGPPPERSQVHVIYPAGVLPGSHAKGSEGRYADVSAQGGFELTAPPGEHWMAASIPDHPDPVARVTVEECGTTVVTLQSPSGVVLEGMVTDPETGKGIPGVRVSASRWDQRMEQPDFCSTKTDERGYYRLSPLAPGKIRVRAYPEKPPWAEKVIEAQQPGVQRVDLELRPLEEGSPNLSGS
ncbi:MAG: carboxypeptidase regulatory-like domain-containing protein, partial [Planctomycetes bacterium]|nr:carboxypeptidase regulatory-like domain-containing protein [Planctomycetota bacterium]